MKYKRILLKLSGEALMGEKNYGIDSSLLEKYSQQIKNIHDKGIEIAFAGRSNAGKSTTINVITNRKNLAKTSKTPGRTQSINIFLINENINLVDLPGYGYAKVSKVIRDNLGILIEEYIIHQLI